MPVESYRVYRVRCDDCRTIYALEGQREGIVNDAQSDGWLIYGRGVLCPSCVDKRQPAVDVDHGSPAVAPGDLQAAIDRADRQRHNMARWYDKLPSRDLTEAYRQLAREADAAESRIAPEPELYHGDPRNGYGLGDW